MISFIPFNISAREPRTYGVTLEKIRAAAAAVVGGYFSYVVKPLRVGRKQKKRKSVTSKYNRVVVYPF